MEESRFGRHRHRRLLSITTTARRPPNEPPEWTIDLRGEFDASQRRLFNATADGVVAAMKRLQSLGEGRVVVDLREVDVLDSSALSCLIRLRKALGEHRLVTRFASSTHRRLLEITGLTGPLNAEFSEHCPS